jgi:hypothetical protein
VLPWPLARIARAGRPATPAGLAGKRNKAPADVEDEMAWYSGYHEGKAERERLQPRSTR